MVTNSTKRIWLGLFLLATAAAAWVLWRRPGPVSQPEASAADLVLDLENGLLSAAKERNWEQYIQYFPPSGRQYLKPGQFGKRPGADCAIESWKVLEVTPRQLPGPEGVPVDGYGACVQCWGTRGEDRRIIMLDEFIDLWIPEEGGWYYQGRRSR
jgi:hypothetical protein